jgi:hypothetical protein
MRQRICKRHKDEFVAWKQEERVGRKVTVAKPSLS